MPMYDFSCSTCESQFEVMKKMSEMDQPLSEPCPTCGATGTITQMTTAAAIGDPIRLGIKKPDAGWNDVMSKIKSAHPRGNWSNNKFQGRSGR